ncbi:GNAT family N-acetyltransferase [Jannaschia sp. LMIT008]|uniref:GNAT family N-acetyltransferase n=1 Tax=Jannaschia maritima TaxID=3032585 RepID=UPI00281131C2|nr:GNAT family N-acetyltransferase [Jannaschia sp. LMIT008]
MPDEPISVRRAGTLDAREMTALLNAIIAAGGTTAYTEPVTREDLTEWMAAPGTVWHVAEAGGTVVGFQWVEPIDGMDRAAIATFAQRGRQGLGIGSALFRATSTLCRTAGFAAIDAWSREDNEGGLAYYRSRGFEDAGRRDGVVLPDGRRVAQTLKRYDLRR